MRMRVFCFLRYYTTVQSRKQCLRVPLGYPTHFLLDRYPQAMPKLAIPLTDNQIIALPPRAKPYTLGDGKGLYLLILPSGDKYWRMGTNRLNKETTLSGGKYPKTSLTDARKWRDEMQRLIDAGINPNERKREQRKQLQISKPKTPKLQFFLNDRGGMTIETYTSRLLLSATQVVALRAFLLAKPDPIEGN